MRTQLYTDIVQALAKAKALGCFEERHRGATMSANEANRVYGSKVLREYERQFGKPDRTGSAGNSKLEYLVTRLEQIVAASEIEQCVVGFELKVRNHQKYMDFPLKRKDEK